MGGGHEHGSRSPLRPDLSKYALVAIGAGVLTIGLKVAAWLLTGSVGLLSDAAESSVNLVAAIGAYVALKVAARPADSDHNFGHTKAEYFSAVLEGVMIVVAAGVIIVSAVNRLFAPQELEQVGVGLAISVLATVINGAVGVYLVRVGRTNRSLALQADGKHLLTDVWTTVGVILGVLLVALTGWLPLDPIIAIAVALNILVVGTRLVWQSGAGLLDAALPEEERARIDEVLDRHRADGVEFHDVRTRESGHERFVQMHMLVPGVWTVDRAHDLAEQVEQELAALFADLRTTIHTEPLDDPRAYESWRLN
ncbi:transporter [Tsukamurella pulmonis]|uniref:Cation diffusion facilitator family transporter n=1 Tax=Tsukamurella pulmonis TaxID=47312 RepID=A0A1H1G993_9ACTN|nr:cation diffusion facilitator family transporter [Tsukamurella pulmonis]KXO87897.1 transporter [Tsukamurella pulmonis]KXP13515.1 transporter [Tsukamurella pulmonis]RDH12795.1 cation transporter [Tsukamurella pulmonis]SDR09760.1 cation diffusion facilitator family transporter [Tsukamurella pulmonis]SUP17636.1 Ferrous-iron efflux pump FieF [Tsukamurella pulmonis]